MDDTSKGGDEEPATAPRSNAARAGVAALNLIAPGLGLLRIGEGRLGLAFLALPYVLIVPIASASGLIPIRGYRTALAAAIAACTIIALLYLVPIVMTWRRSRSRRSMPPRWSRWYALTAVAATSITLSTLATPITHRFYKAFHESSTSMAPTIGLGDSLVADMRWRGPVDRGDVILFESGGGVRISRVAAVPGDRIALRRGVPIIDGRPVTRRTIGVVHLAGDEVGDGDGDGNARLSIERLPGETSPHRVLDIGDSPFGDVRETVVPEGHVFVLGDNRDRSADSRMPRSQLGVGMVPVGGIVGRPLYIRWSSDHARIGERLDR